VAVVVVSILVYFVLPTFTELFDSFGSDLPPITQLLINITDFLTAYGILLFMVLGAALVAVVLYIRTAAGKYWWSGVILRMPVIGRIIQLSELSRVCQTISLLFRAGLPLPEILTQAMNAAGNGIVAEALEGVHHDLIRGEGLSGPMRRRPIFLPLMVQMVSVGEETGKLDDTLSTVVTTYEIEADDKISSAIALLQPTMLIVIGIVVAFIASALVSSMYGMYEAFE
jgi:type IV pilus assembly protein PilC